MKRNKKFDWGGQVRSWIRRAAYPHGDYFTDCIDRGEAVPGQPALQNYYHRSVETILQTAFSAGFVVDGFHEVPFEGKKTPIIMIVRLRKQ